MLIADEWMRMRKCDLRKLENMRWCSGSLWWPRLVVTMLFTYLHKNRYRLVAARDTPSTSPLLQQSAAMQHTAAAAHKGVFAPSKCSKRQMGKISNFLEDTETETTLTTHSSMEEKWSDNGYKVKIYNEVYRAPIKECQPSRGSN